MFLLYLNMWERENMLNHQPNLDNVQLNKLDKDV